MQYLPDQEYILSEKDRFQFSKNAHNIELVKNIPFGSYDPYATLPLVKAGLINIKLWQEKRSKEALQFYSPIIKNIIEGKYSSIIYKPADDGIIIDTIILFIRELSSKENIPFNVLFPMECHLFLPTVEDRCTDCKHLINLYFTNASHCSILKERANEYFNEHYDKICKKDKHSAEFIKSAFKYNGVDFDKTCEGGNLLERYEKRNEINIMDMVFIISIVFISLLFYLSKNERRKLFFDQLISAFRDNKKFLIVIFVATALIIILFYGITPSCASHYISYKNKCFRNVL